MAESEHSPERIAELSAGIASKVSITLRSLEKVNLQARILSFNAQLEAASAGEHGRAFSVVATAMRDLSQTTQEIAVDMERKVKTDIEQLGKISQGLSGEVRGQRFSDLALANIDLIDRNLYERSCDVRWWATDASLVDACKSKEAEQSKFACHRMGVILDAYTVYFDLVLCDTNGTVIANGRPKEFRSIGQSFQQADWFRQAMRSKSGDEFGFQGVHRSALVNNQWALVYSCGIRENGNKDAALVGVLGVVFRWEALAQTIMERTPFSDSEKATARACLCDASGTVIADSKGAPLGDRLELNAMGKITTDSKGYGSVGIAGHKFLVGHALSPGYETYRTGWHSFVMVDAG